jgi:polygalacturonase
VDIRDHGAVADDATDCTAAIASAIASCADVGGGRVLIPAGSWFTGAIHLRSNVELHLAEGATLRFSSDPLRYLPPVFVRWGGRECYNYSPLIYAHNCQNIAITGRGRILGQGEAWWSWDEQEPRSSAALHQMVLQGVPVEQRVFGNQQHPLRPSLIMTIGCVNVLLDGFTIAEGGPQWSIHVAYSHNVIIRGLTINAPDGPNNDGIDIDSSCEVLIEDCELRTADDCIALKSGMNEDGWRVGKATENVVVRRIRATSGHGGITIGSEMSGGVRNVFVHDCHYDGPTAGIRMKAARGRGGVVENIFVRDITMGHIRGDAIQMTTEYPTFVRPDGRAPTFRNIHLANVTCQSAHIAVRMIGLPEVPFQDISLSNVTISAVEGMHCSSVSEVYLTNVTITPRTGPAMSMKDSQDVHIHGLGSARDGCVFLDLRGRQTRNIRIHGDHSDQIRPAVVLGIDVPRDAIVHE